jgi:hypothetical protein
VESDAKGKVNNAFIRQDNLLHRHPYLLDGFFGNGQSAAIVRIMKSIKGKQENNINLLRRIIAASAGVIKIPSTRPIL